MFKFLNKTLENDKKRVSRKHAPQNFWGDKTKRPPKKRGGGIKEVKKLTNREKEIIYFALSRLLDDKKLIQKEFNEIDNLRDRFYTGNELPTF